MPWSSAGGGGAGSGSVWTGKKKIIVTGSILSGATINANAAGVNHTVEGDSVNFGINAGEFAANDSIYIALNGIDQEKGIDVIYVSSSSFETIVNFDAGDIIIIMF